MPHCLFAPAHPQQYVSPEHSKASVPNNSQGPVYKIYVSALLFWMPLRLAAVHPLPRRCINACRAADAALQQRAPFAPACPAAAWRSLRPRPWNAQGHNPVDLFPMHLLCSHLWGRSSSPLSPLRAPSALAPAPARRRTSRTASQAQVRPMRHSARVPFAFNTVLMPNKTRRQAPAHLRSLGSTHSHRARRQQHRRHAFTAIEPAAACVRASISTEGGCKAAIRDPLQPDWHPPLLSTGQYNTPVALGEQKVTKRCTSPRAVFGTATRDGQAKVRSVQGKEKIMGYQLRCWAQSLGGAGHRGIALDAHALMPSRPRSLDPCHTIAPPCLHAAAPSCYACTLPHMARHRCSWMRSS